MSRDAQGVTDGAPQTLAPGEAAIGPTLNPKVTRAPNPAATNDSELSDPDGTNARAEKVRRVQLGLRRGKPTGVEHSVWE